MLQKKLIQEIPHNPDFKLFSEREKGSFGREDLTLLTPLSKRTEGNLLITIKGRDFNGFQF